MLTASTPWRWASVKDGQNASSDFLAVAVPQPNDLHAIRRPAADHRQIVLPAAHRLLIHAQVRIDLRCPPLQPPRHRTILDPRRLVPAQAQQLAGAFDRHLLENIDRQPLKQGGESAVLLRPGHLDRLAPVLGTAHAGHLRHQDRLELATVQMPPTPRLAVVDLHPLPAIRTGPVRLFQGHLHFNHLLSRIEPDAFHVPRFRGA